MVEPPQLDLERLRGWVGREESAEDRCDAARVRQLAASFDMDTAPWRDGAELPPLWHWIFTAPVTPLGAVGPDGHAARGGFLPPVPLARRMWAGSRLRWQRLPRLGEPLRRASRVESVELKHGKSGALVFVKVAHELRSGEAPLLSEEQDIVYRDAPLGARPAPNPPAAPPVWRDTLEAASARTPARCTLVPDDVLLFRYSALTFNSHRIHYDRRHCLEAEGYPGLVVHGPLMATLMATLAWLQSGRRAPQAFSFRAQAPVFDGEAIEVHAAHDGKALARTEVRKADGSVAMAGEMRWA
ncbi:MAG: MaoC family dehydratase N-terminal domain-containing protein [Betaproteobacteria bacterium]|nr:MaoC family dehydratase N-terminal domain-containing protein [Betaproteobacteria bacterium]